METKQQIRKDHLRRRNEISRQEAAAASKKASEQLCRFFRGREAELKARGVYGYYPHGTELSLISLYEWMLGKGVPLAFPRVSGAEMEFYRVFSMEEFAEGSFGIMEPICGCAQEERENAVCLVPGSVFDRRGNRYGYGKGYYDRYFARYLGVYRIGVAYESQVEDEIPFDCYDVKMQALATENGVLFFRERRRICMELLEICRRARAVKQQVGALSTNQKNQALLAVAERLVSDTDVLIRENQIDLSNGKKNNMPEGLLDRLLLNEERIRQMADGLRQIARLEDPIGEVISMKNRPNGLRIGKKRVPLGVIGIIYESRPNVTADAFGLCFKTGNVVILRGGKDAIHSNQAIVASIQEALNQQGLPAEAISFISDTSHETAKAFMGMNGYVDVLIPRGGAGLIRTVVSNATIPVIETGTGNCHIFVDESADFEMAISIIVNAKTQRIGVCNACESLLVHEKIVKEFIPELEKRLKNVEIRADEAILSASVKDAKAVLASEEDWATEYLDYKISAKTVASVEEAISHINRYNTGHSEAIITNNYANAQKFLDEVDAAAVYVNASTRFTDGFEFGFGAEIGISTQKLHARGPMGLEALTSTKYVIYGNGQIRP